MFDLDGSNPVLLWTPVIERDFGQERFLTENPTLTYIQGRFAQVPVITGMTELEFAGPAIRKISLLLLNFLEL